MIAQEPADALIEQGEAALDEGEFEEALACFEEALELDPEHWGASIARAEALLYLWRLDEGLEAIRSLTPPEDEEDDPERAELEARALEAKGDFTGADRLFAEAHRIEPEEFPLPVRTEEADFRGILDRVLESLPAVIRDAVAVVPILVVPKPTPEIADRESHITPEVLGLFVGTPVGERAHAPSGYPDVVLLFQRNLERAGRSRTEVAKEIKITLLHEYGHYLGFDEEELEHLGLG